MCGEIAAPAAAAAEARGSSSIALYYYSIYSTGKKHEATTLLGFTSSLLLGSPDSAALVTQYWEDSLFFNSCAAVCVRKNARCPFCVVPSAPSLHILHTLLVLIDFCPV